MPWYNGKRVSQEWLTVLTAAEKDRGRTLRLNSGQRTMGEQARLYALYLSGRGNLAAVPSPIAPHIRVGRPDHALDIDVYSGDAAWFDAWATAKGYPLDNTVRGEAWHKEIRGGADALRALARDLGGPQYPTLRQGAWGKDVIRLKKLLAAKGMRNFSGARSSNRFNPYYSQYTKATVRRWQLNRGLYADGIAGPKTWASLKK